jgi:two-component system sensor histidine kinase HydH
MQKVKPDLLWTILILLMVLIVTSLHYNTHTHHTPLHALYRKLYYIPILISAFRFGFKGALICALSCATLYFPHLHCDWGADYLIKNADRSLEVLLYVVIAVITGTYSSYQKKLVAALQKSHNTLKLQTEDLLTAQNVIRKQEKLHAVSLLGAGISHEIRNPLASLKGILEIVLMENESCDAKQKSELSKIAFQEVCRIQDVLNNFLTLSKEETSDCVEVNLKEVCQNLVDLTKTEANKNELALKLQIPSADCVFIGPSSSIQQVVLNLLLNAIAVAKHSIDIKLFKDDQQYKIQVIDDGEGISKDLETAIFDFFYTTKQNGNGLGLAISAELMHQIGGDIKIIQNVSPTILQISFPEKVKYSNGGKHKVTI